MQQLASRMSVMSGEGALTIFARAKELERSGRSIIHLELGEPDFHPAKSVNEALKQAIDEGKDRYCPYSFACFARGLWRLIYTRRVMSRFRPGTL